MRAVSVLLVLGWSLLGCPRNNDAGPDASVTIPFAAQRAAAHRCRLEATNFRLTNKTLELPWLVEGPAGLRVVAGMPSGAELFWRDAHVREGHAPVQASLPSDLSPSPQAVGWTGRGFVGVAGGQLTFTNADFSSPRPIRRVTLDRAMVVATASREGAVLVAWIQRRHVDDLEGAPWVALVGADGELLMDPRPLSGAPSTLRSIEVRWDYGRFVAQGVLSGDNSLWSWVLEPDGRPNWDASGRVACPVSGCVRVELIPPSGGQYPSDPNGQLQVQPESQVLRLSPLHDSVSSVDTTILTRDVQALAVSGDRLLVLHTPTSGGSGSTIHVYDVGRRVVVHESSSDTLHCGPGSVIATPAGFSLLEFDSTQGIAVHALSCGDDA